MLGKDEFTVNTVELETFHENEWQVGLEPLINKYPESECYIFIMIKNVKGTNFQSKTLWEKATEIWKRTKYNF